MITSPVSSSPVRFVQIGTASIQGPPADDESLLGSYLRILAYYFQTAGAGKADKSLAALQALPSLIQSANVQTADQRQVAAVDVAGVAAALSEPMVQAFQNTISNEDVTDLCRAVAESMVAGGGLAVAGGSASQDLIVLDASTPDLPRIGSLQCIVTATGTAPGPVGSLGPRQDIKTQVNWTAFTVNDSHRDAALSFVQDMVKQKKLVPVIPDELRVAVH